MPKQRFCLEIVSCMARSYYAVDKMLIWEQCETNVLPTDLPPYPGNPKIQHPGLQATHGTVPKGYPQSATGTAHAEAERVCIFASRRGTITVDSGIRYHEGKRKIRRNEECSTRGSTSLITNEWIWDLWIACS